jgi:putative holliday junction resolvase
MSTLLEEALPALAALPQNLRLMALDLGSKTIGVATADYTRQLATPRHTIGRTKFTADAKALITFAAAENIGLIVLGLPLNMDGTEGPRCQSTRTFARNFGKLSPIPIIFWDERLSSLEAEDQMIEAGVRYEKRQANIDQMAAAVILQGLLDEMRQSNK